MVLRVALNWLGTFATNCTLSEHFPISLPFSDSSSYYLQPQRYQLDPCYFELTVDHLNNIYSSGETN